jgi:hypothetical protein
LQHGASTHDEQSSQIRVAALGDVPEPRLAAARVLARDEAEPGGELAAVLEVMAIANSQRPLVFHPDDFRRLDQQVVSCRRGQQRPGQRIGSA